MKKLIAITALLLAGQAAAWNNTYGNSRYDVYDSRGRHQGVYQRDYSGNYNSYDSRGRHQGTVSRDYSGNYNIYDSRGRHQGTIQGR